MRLKHACAIVAALSGFVAITGEATAQRVVDWVPLGCQRVTFNIDRDVIRVGRQDGRFRAIRLRARGNNVNMLDLKVIYANGEPDDIPVRALIRAGSQSGRLDLRGLDRAIDRVELIYQAQPNFRGQATICVDGLVVAAVGPGPGSATIPAPSSRWVVLGCKQVGFNIDRDVIPVGVREGAFHALRLRARRNDIFMLDLKVVYGNGTAEDLPVRAQIRAGATSGAIDLTGARRNIQRIEMIYQSRPNFRGQAEVCVEAAE
jgi:hypothetical protein